MNKNLKESIKSITYFIFLSIVVFIYIVSDNGLRYNTTVLMLSFLISVISLFQIFRNYSYPYSLNLIFHLWILFFCGIAPAIQFKQKKTFWGESLLDVNDYIIGNIVIVFILILYNFSYTVSTSNFKYKRQIFIDKANQINVNIFLLGIFSVAATFVFLYSSNFNFYSIFFRSGRVSQITENLNVQNLSLKLIVGNSFRPIPVICFLIIKLFKSKKNNHFLVNLFFILLVLISNFPLGMARFQVAAMYIPILLIYFKTLNRPINFALLFCLGFLVVFPFLNQFRYFDNNPIKLDFNTEMFQQGHFDSYQNTVSVISNNEVTYGNQLFGVLFFYVPRAVWSTKPVGSGAYIAKKNNYYFSNISMSFFGEGYINFGYFGLIIFTITLSYFNARIDFKYWISQYKSNLLKIFYMILLGMQFFILRGDLMSSSAYTIAILISTFIVLKLCVQNK